MNITEQAAIVLQEINAAIALAEKATPGPWGTDGHEVVAVEQHPICNVSWTVHRVANAAFIAASREGWPASLRCLKTAIEGRLKERDELIRSDWEPVGIDTALTTLCDQWKEQQ